MTSCSDAPRRREPQAQVGIAEPYASTASVGGLLGPRIATSTTDKEYEHARNGIAPAATTPR